MLKGVVRGFLGVVEQVNLGGSGERRPFKFRNENIIVPGRDA